MPDPSANLKESATDDLASQIESLLGTSDENSASAVTKTSQETDTASPGSSESPSTDALTGEMPLRRGDLAGQVERMLDDAIERAENLAAEMESPGDEVPGDPPHAAPVSENVQATPSAPSRPAAGEAAHDPSDRPVESQRQFEKPAKPRTPAPGQPIATSHGTGRTNPSSILLAAGAIARLLAAPLANRSAAVRDSVGWIALVTVFMAACMWAAVMLRDPKPLPTATPAVSLSTGEAAGGATQTADHGGHAAGAGAAKSEHSENASTGEPYTQKEPLIKRGSAGRKPPAKEKAPSGH